MVIDNKVQKIVIFYTIVSVNVLYNGTIRLGRLLSDH